MNLSILPNLRLDHDGAREAGFLRFVRVSRVVAFDPLAVHYAHRNIREQRITRLCICRWCQRRISRIQTANGIHRHGKNPAPVHGLDQGSRQIPLLHSDKVSVALRHSGAQ